MRVPWSWTTVPALDRWDNSSLSNFLSGLNRSMKLLENALKYTGNLSYGVRVSPDQATTPSVSGIKVLQTNNTAPTSITALTTGEPGQVVIVSIGDANTTLVHSAGLRLTGSVNWVGVANQNRAFMTLDGINFAEVGYH